MRRSRRIAAGAMALAAVVGLGLAPHVAATDAAFTDPEHTTATIAAGTVQPLVPLGTPGCTANGGLLGILPSVTITWQVPTGSGFTSADVEFGQLNTQGLLVPILDLELLNSITTSGTPASYTTRVSGLMLQNLLGGQKKIGMRINGPGDWTSRWMVVTATWSPLNLASNTCVITFEPAA